MPVLAFWDGSRPTTLTGHRYNGTTAPLTLFALPTKTLETGGLAKW